MMTYLVVLAVLLGLGWYLSLYASRLDRLHQRVIAARISLEVQLARRAAVALDVVELLDPASGLLVGDAVARSLERQPEPGTVPESMGVDAELEEVESDLTGALVAVFDSPERVGELQQLAGSGGAIARLQYACLRVQLARRFHNDAVAGAQRVRRKRVVRWARLAGYADWPQMVEMDDTVPPGLVDLPPEQADP